MYGIFPRYPKWVLFYFWDIICQELPETYVVSPYLLTPKSFPTCELLQCLLNTLWHLVFCYYPPVQALVLEKMVLPISEHPHHVTLYTYPFVPFSLLQTGASCHGKSLLILKLFYCGSGIEAFLWTSSSYTAPFLWGENQNRTDYSPYGSVINLHIMFFFCLTFIPILLIPNIFSVLLLLLFFFDLSASMVYSWTC